MKIMEKIRVYRDAIREEPDGSISKRIQEQSVAAIMAGKGNTEWENFMKNFHSNDKQLQRLLGEDTAFMNLPNGYGPTILAYIAGGGPCGGGTAMSLAANLPFDLRGLLDDDIDSDTVPGESTPLPAELEKFLPA